MLLKKRRNLDTYRMLLHNLNITQSQKQNVTKELKYSILKSGFDNRFCTSPTILQNLNVTALFDCNVISVFECYSTLRISEYYLETGILR